MHKKHKPCIQGLTKNGFIVIDDRMILSLKKKSKSYHGELLVRRDYVLRHAYVFLYGLQRDTKIFGKIALSNVGGVMSEQETQTIKSLKTDNS